MQKLPKMGLVTCLGLLLAAASCEKKTVEPDDTNSCTACGGTFDEKIVKLKVFTMNLSKIPEDPAWVIRSNDDYALSASLPCKFPKELLIDKKEFIIDGKKQKLDIPKEIKSQVTYTICIEKIY